MFAQSEKAELSRELLRSGSPFRFRFASGDIYEPVDQIGRRPSLDPPCRGYISTGVRAVEPRRTDLVDRLRRQTVGHVASHISLILARFFQNVTLWHHFARKKAKVG